MGDGLVFLEYPDPVVWWHLILWGCVVAFGSFCIGATGAGGIISVLPLLLQLESGQLSDRAAGAGHSAAPQHDWACRHRDISARVLPSSCDQGVHNGCAAADPSLEALFSRPYCPRAFVSNPVMTRQLFGTKRARYLGSDHSH